MPSRGPGLTALCACTGLDALVAVLEFRLGAMELGEGGGEVLELLVELLLDLGELLGREGVEVDWRKSCQQLDFIGSKMGMWQVISLVSCWPDILLSCAPGDVVWRELGCSWGLEVCCGIVRFGGVEMPDYIGCSR